jgi:hypothetical protein
MYYSYGEGGRKQVQLSMHQRDLDNLNELIALVTKESPGGWHPTRYKKVDRSSVVIDLVEAELKRRKASAEPAKPKKKKSTDATDH